MANKFNITIGAIDNATKVVRKIKTQFSKFTRPITNLQRSVGRLGKEIGFDKMRASIGKATRAAQDFGGRLFSLGAPLMGLIGGGTIAGLSSMISGFASASVQAQNMAASIGISARDLAGYRGAASMAGLSAGEMDSSLKSLNQTMQDAGAGRNQQAYFFMRRLGMQFRRTKDGAIDTTKTLSDLSKVITNPKIKNNPAVQQRIASTFGVESLLPMLRKGPEAIAEFQKKMDSVTFSPSKKGMENASRFHESMELFKASVGGVKDAIADKLIPVLMPVIAKFTEWIVKNRELISSKVEDFFKRLVSFIEKIDFEELINQCKGMFSAIGSVVDALGGWKTIVIAIAGIKLAGFIASIVSTAGALTNVLAPALRLILGLIISNPIGATIAAIAAAAYLIYRNWDEVKAFFIEAWQEIKEAFDGGLLGISKLIINWSPIGLFYRVFQKVMDYFGIKLPKKFTDFGSNIIKNLIRGVKGEAPILMSEVDDIGDGINNRLENKKNQSNFSGWGNSSQSGSQWMPQWMGGGGNAGQNLGQSIAKSLRIKNSEATAGGTTHDATFKLAKILQGAKGNNLVRFAAFNDEYHQKRFKRGGADSRHRYGLAFDASFKNRQQGYQAVNDIKQYLSSLGFRPGKDFFVQYELKSKKNTAEHLHFQWQNQGAANRFSGNYQMPNINNKNSLIAQNNGPLEITINAPSRETTVEAKRGDQVVPVKVNYAMSSDF